MARTTNIDEGGLPYAVWQQIQDEIDRKVREYQGPLIVQGIVIKNDTQKNLIWLREFGSQPIPIFTFQYSVKYYDTQPTGVVTSGDPVDTQLIPKQAIVTPLCPAVGDIVLVLRQHGSRRLPKCIGVLRSTDFVLPSS